MAEDKDKRISELEEENRQLKEVFNSFNSELELTNEENTKIKKSFNELNAKYQAILSKNSEL